MTTKKKGKPFPKLFREAVVSITLQDGGLSIGRLTSIRFNGGVTRDSGELEKYVLQEVRKQLKSMLEATDG